MLKGIKHCHDKGYCHRDLKPENVFFGHKHLLKLADFGFACALNGRDGSGKIWTPLGT